MLPRVSPSGEIAFGLAPRVRQRQSFERMHTLWFCKNEYKYHTPVVLPENVHAVEGLACRKRVAPASSTLAAALGLLAHALVTKQ